MASSNIIPITKVISISAVQVGAALEPNNPSNLALFTTDAPGSSVVSTGYGVYSSASGVATDFGSGSVTYQMAEAVFGQAPNILVPGGQLICIPMVVAAQTLTFSGVAASGSFDIDLPAGNATSISWDDTSAAIQTKIQALTGYGQITVTGSIASQSLVITFYGVYGPVTLATIANNTLETSGSSAITVTPAATTVGETIGAAITRTQSLVQYFGIISTQLYNSTDTLAAAAVVQALNAMLIVGSRTQADIETGGTFVEVQQAKDTQTRCLYYGGSTDLSVLQFMAAYAGRGFSVDFSGSNTTLDMHLKQLSGIDPDPTMTETILSQAQTAGADCYVSLQGYPCVYAALANHAFDSMYNLLWFTMTLQVELFNFLAGTSTKVPQTEDAMNAYKGVARALCNQAVTNQYVAPGTWSSSQTFGNQTLFLNNIQQYGYYIYTTPIAQQTESQRAARQAPLMQIALKEAGSVDSGSVLLIVNA